MPTNYQERLKIPLNGDDKTIFTTISGLHVATGYTRVVIGGRGPYVEFRRDQIAMSNLRVPPDQEYRSSPKWIKRVFYLEWRTIDQANVKVYDQLKTVNYADYRVGLLYISPFDLLVGGVPAISTLENTVEAENEAVDPFANAVVR